MLEFKLLFARTGAEGRRICSQFSSSKTNRTFVAESSLGAAGYQTFAARNAEQALTILRDHPGIDLLFTDTYIAGPTSGVGLARTAKRVRPDIKVPLCNQSD